MPRDEYFSEVKLENHTDTTKKGTRQAFVPGLENLFIGKELGFPYFTAIDELFNEDDDLAEVFQEKLKNIFRRIITFLPFSVKKVLRFGTPALLDSTFLTIVLKLIFLFTCLVCRTYQVRICHLGL